MCDGILTVGTRSSSIHCSNGELAGSITALPLFLAEGTALRPLREVGVVFVPGWEVWASAAGNERRLRTLGSWPPSRSRTLLRAVSGSRRVDSGREAELLLLCAAGLEDEDPLNN